MYYELVILGRLMYAPYHGYLMMHVISEMVGPWQKVSPGTLYPLLGRLEEDGLIKSYVDPDATQSRRTTRIFQITDAGQARFRELMLDLASSIGEYQRLFYLKIPHLEFMSQAERLLILEHYRDYCRVALRHQERISQELQQAHSSRSTTVSETEGITTQGLANGLLLTRHLHERWVAELAWVEQLILNI